MTHWMLHATSGGTFRIHALGNCQAEEFQCHGYQLPSSRLPQSHLCNLLSAATGEVLPGDVPRVQSDAHW
jgi:hypothetical protein